MAAQWYQNHIGGATRVLLITNDRENRRKAVEEGICAETSTLDVYLLLALLQISVSTTVLYRVLSFSYTYLTWLICIFFTVESYVRSLGQTHLLDLLVQSANEDTNMEEVEDMRPSKRKVLYFEVLHELC